MYYRFSDREEAGHHLVDALEEYHNRKDTIILALPRGGVPVAAVVAEALHLPLDVLLVRKLGVPGHAELAMGAIAWGDICYLNHDIVHQLQIPESAIKQVIARERQELERRNRLYRDEKPAPNIKGKTVIIIDDGLATGATMQASVSALKQAQAGEIIIAVPVGAKDSCNALESQVDKLICLYTPEPFYGVGQWYNDFSQTSDSEVQDLLAMSELEEG